MEEKFPPFIFSEWLKRRRKALDLTQEELAQRAGCSVFALRKIETGERRPSKQLAALLEKALEIPNEDQPTFIRVARGELNLERLRQPSTDIQAPFSNISALKEARSSASFNAGPKLTSLANRIPLPATPLIGRESELAALERLFIDPQCRLLTLTGVGGIGKTRLAIEFATKHFSIFPGGVFYIPLTPVKTPEEIVPAIADVLEFGFSGPTDPKEQLLNYMASQIRQAALLILDNLEQLLFQASPGDAQSGVAELASEMLKRLPNVKILGTSRERLNLQGEWPYELHGLSVPPDNFAGQLEEYEAIVLFYKSAQRVKADFQIPIQEQPSLARICQIVEGIPLAIELAAAWVDMLSCHEIAQEIQSNMDFLTTSMRDIPERHRSIRATFDHSWNLLTDAERQVLCQLSVFRGGFDRNAANQVAGASLPLLASLGAKSLIRRAENGRYDLHEVIRQYALTHLQYNPKNAETHRRHSEYYLKYAPVHEKMLKSAAQQEAVRQLTDEIDNIRAAWMWAISHQEYKQIGQAVRSLGWYFEVAGLLREGIEHLEPLAEALKNRPADHKWDRVLGQALIQLGLLYFRKGEFDQAQSLYEEGILILRPLGDKGLLADALVYWGIILHLRGDYPRSKAAMEEGLVLARSGNEPWFEAFAIYNLGYLSSLMGNYAEGYEQLLHGLTIWRAIGDPHSISLGLNFFVPTLIKLSRFEEAKAYMLESIALCEQSKNRWGMGTAYRFLGLATLAEGGCDEAQIHFRKSLEVFGEYIVGWDIARSLTYLGDAILISGNLTEARSDYRKALRLSIEAKAIPVALDALWGLSSLQGQAGKT